MRKTKHNGTIEITGIKAIEYETLKICPEDLAAALEGIVEKRVLKREGGAGQMTERLHSDEWTVVFQYTNPEDQMMLFQDGHGPKDARQYRPTLQDDDEALLFAAKVLRSGKIE